VTFKDIVDLVLEERFAEEKRDNAKHWVNVWEGKVWNATDWAAKDAPDLSLPLSGGSGKFGLPPGMGIFSQALQMLDEHGMMLEYVPPDRFAELYDPYLLQGAGSGPAEVWTMYYDSVAGAGQFQVAPAPAGNLSYRLQGWNLPIHRSTPTTSAPGMMVADGDMPWWVDGYEFFLVPGAISLGLKLENDPTWPPLEAEANTGLQTLVDLLNPEQRTETRQWGKVWQ
jgi:hypothetical protein